MTTDADKVFSEQMITLTSYPEFKVWVEETRKEIYQLQANLLQNSKNWDQVCFVKGLASGLMQIINLREITLAAKKLSDEQDILDTLEEVGDANV